MYSSAKAPVSLALRPVGGEGVDHWMGVNFFLGPRRGLRVFAIYINRRGMVRSGGGSEIFYTFLNRPFPLLTLALGTLGDGGGAAGIYGKIEVSGEAGVVDWNGFLHLEKAFATERDVVDVILGGSATVKITSSLSTGLRYLVQDLEDLWENEEAEGGMLQEVSFLISMKKGTLGAGLAPGIVMGRSNGFSMTFETKLMF